MTMKKNHYHSREGVEKPMRDEQGIVLVLAVIFSGLFLVIGLAIGNIYIKNYTLSVSARESSIALAGADTGVECALYYDLKVVPSPFSNDGVTPIECNNQTIDTGTQTEPEASVIGGDGRGNPRTVDSSFWLFFGAYPSAPCAKVTVEKHRDGSAVIEGRGYNTCDTDDNRRVERAIRVWY